MIVLVATIGILGSVPGQTMGVNVFTAPLRQACGITALMLSIAYGIGTIISGALMPLAGSLIDRWGCRRMSMLAGLVLAGSLFWASHSDQVGIWLAELPLPWQFLAEVFSIEAAQVAQIAGLSALFLILRSSGQGMLTLANRTMIGRWFEHKRGRAAAISTLGIAFGFAMAPAAFNALSISARCLAMDWYRPHCDVLGCQLGIRPYNPEQCGLVPDGVSSRSKRAATTLPGS